MSRTPTYTRLNVDELAGKDPADFVDKPLLIEDDRPSGLGGVRVPDAWMAVARKVRIGGRTIKDLDRPIDPTERRGLGRVG